MPRSGKSPGYRTSLIILCLAYSMSPATRGPLAIPHRAQSSLLDSDSSSTLACTDSLRPTSPGPSCRHGVDLRLPSECAGCAQAENATREAWEAAIEDCAALLCVQEKIGYHPLTVISRATETSNILKHDSGWGEYRFFRAALLCHLRELVDTRVVGIKLKRVRVMFPKVKEVGDGIEKGAFTT